MTTDQKAKMYQSNHESCVLGLKTCKSCIFNPLYSGMDEAKVTEIVKAELTKEVQQSQAQKV